jgi:hypothetical protein
MAHLTPLHSKNYEELLQRVRAEYTEMPSLRLTPSQAQRLFGLEPSAGGAVLDALLTENFLCRTSDGLFMRSATRK